MTITALLFLFAISVFFGFILGELIHSSPAYLTRTRLELQQAIIDSKIADQILKAKRENKES